MCGSRMGLRIIEVVLMSGWRGMVVGGRRLPDFLIKVLNILEKIHLDLNVVFQVSLLSLQAFRV